MNYTEITYIYALYDPRTPNIIRYIGKSNNPKGRLKQHKRDVKSKTSTCKINWIKSISGNIEMKILKVCPLSGYEINEAYYVQLHKSDKLTNSDETGLGNVGRKKEIIESSSEKMSKKVYQYDLNGVFLNEYKSVREASRQLSIDHSQITRACNGVAKHANGFIFTYNKEKNIKKIVTPNAVKKQVIEVDNNGNEINKWSSLMECSRNTKIDNGNLSRVCNGKLPSIKSRFFKFL